MHEVPDLRGVGVRMIGMVVALALGLLCSVAIAFALPAAHQREASAFAPLSLILAMGIGLARGWYALFDALRRKTPTRMRPYAPSLPVARVARRRTTAACRAEGIE